MFRVGFLLAKCREYLIDPGLFYRGVINEVTHSHSDDLPPEYFRYNARTFTKRSPKVKIKKINLKI